jgi:hypothetical protein
MIWPNIFKTVACTLADHCGLLRTVTVTFSLLSVVLGVRCFTWRFLLQRRAHFMEFLNPQMNFVMCRNTAIMIDFTIMAK